MFLLLNKSIFILAFVFIIFMVESSTSSSLENDKLAQLIERLDRMQTEMDAMRSREVENTQLTERLDGIQSRVEVLELENEKWAKKFADLEEENEKLKSLISHPKSSLSAEPKRDNGGQSSKVLSSPPTSCQELKDRNGNAWPMDGIHLLKVKNKIKAAFCIFPADGNSSDNIFSILLLFLDFRKIDRPSRREDQPRPFLCPTKQLLELKNKNGKIWPMDGIHLLKKQNQIKAAFCTFPPDSSPVSENLLGQVDVKTRPIHFYVHKKFSFNSPYAVIPFEFARLNEGDAFDLASGNFTVPVSGIYHFDFSAVKSDSAHLWWISLQVNGAEVGRAGTNQYMEGSYISVSSSASLRLAAGDKVNLLMDCTCKLYDSHFSGWLFQEDLM